MSDGAPRSRWWFLLPILFGLIGAVISYFVLRDDDPKLAKNCLYLGLALFAVSTVSYMAVDSAILVGLEGYGVNP